MSGRLVLRGAHGLITRLGAAALAVALPLGGCMALTPQLPPTDFAEIEEVSDRSERERLYQDNAIAKFEEPQGTRYTKGTDPMATKRSWQSLDVILRSDATSAAALPVRRLRLSRLFTALTVASGILTIAGTAASAREGLDLKELNGTGGLLLGAGLATVAFGLTAGILYGKSRKQYERAVTIYNDSLAMRLGLNTASGAYIPPAGMLIDDEGYVVLKDESDAIGPEEEVEDVPYDPPPELPAEPAPADDLAPEPVQPEPATAADPVVSAPEPPEVPEPPGGGSALPPSSHPLSLSPRG